MGQLNARFCKEANETRNKEKCPATDAKHVKLYFMIPPIAKMDAAALSTLKACEHLALSTNNIDKIANLSAMENLKILSLGRNNIKKLENLDGLASRLEQLWISYNPIDKLSGIEKLKELTVLFMGNCKVASEKEFDKLAECPKLEELVMYGNPIHKNIVDKDGELGWPKYVQEKLPGLRKLDGITMVEWNQKMQSGNAMQLKEMFERMDADGNGTLSVKELKDAMQDEDVRLFLKLKADKVDEAFKKMDEDGSGDVSWDEFQAFFSVA
jgi:dynein light chain 1